MSRLPVWKQAPAEQVTALALVWAFFRVHMARHAPGAGLTKRHAERVPAGKAWVGHRIARQGGPG
ncbi:hypothetical protein [Marinactinospora rubrisoli]|uniref:Uncharacterized protein n=1 Tax=Marinactinospora rubrisoli TaxID=2715399 RepID=A0ABW2KGZ3_9ACTN